MSGNSHASTSQRDVSFVPSVADHACIDGVRSAYLVHGFSLGVVSLVLLSPCVCPASATEPNRIQVDASVESTFAPGQWPLFVPVWFDSRAHDFVLDTGCTGSIFDLSLRPRLGEPRGKRKIWGLGNPMTAQVFAPPRVSPGLFDFADCNAVACVDLRGFAEVVGRDVYGVLGMDVLRKHILRIDFDEGRIAFLRSGQEDRREWGVELPITYNAMKTPQIRLAVDGQPEQDFIVDTGCETTGTLTKDSFRRVVEQGRLKPADTAMATFSGVVKSGQIRVDRLAAGPFKYHGLIFSEAKGNVLGLGFLSRHVVTFDFPLSRLYLRKGRSFDKADEAGMCGVGIVRREGRIVVSDVYKNEPAAKAGVRTGDVIVKLNGRDASTYERWQIRDLMRSGHGKEITITVQRDSEIKDVKVVLERQL